MKSGLTKTDRQSLITNAGIWSVPAVTFAFSFFIESQISFSEKEVIFTKWESKSVAEAL